MRSTQQLSAYDDLKNKLTRLELKPGQRIKEAELQEKLDVGRTPLREALIQLKSEGLITIVPQSGTYVSKINQNLIQDGIFIRKVVEKEVVQIAIEKPSIEFLSQLELNIAQTKILTTIPNMVNLFELDTDFHQFFYQEANKQQVWNWLQIASADLNRFTYLALMNQNKPADFIIRHHQAILNSIKARYIEQTLQLIDEHFTYVLKVYDELVNKYPDYFLEDKETK